MLAALVAMTAAVGVSVHLPPSDSLELAHDLGAGWVRIDFNWDIGEPQQGQYDSFDELKARLAAAPPGADAGANAPDAAPGSIDAAPGTPDGAVGGDGGDGAGAEFSCPTGSSGCDDGQGCSCRAGGAPRPLCASLALAAALLLCALRRATRRS
jgi:hypothetical protein